MLIETISQLFERDLLKAAEEIEKYPTEGGLWELREGIGNSGGNLGLHLAGNINHFFGAVLGHTGYVRQRDAEFTSKGITKAEIAAALKEAAKVAVAALATMTDEDLPNDYPEQFQGQTVSNSQMIFHLLTHLNYHLGQINYHRRLLAN